MRTPPRFSRRRSSLPAGLLILSTAAAAAALAPSSAVAAGSPFTCEASLLQSSISTAPTIEPLVTNRGQACKTTNAGLPNLAAPLGIVSINALAAATKLTGPADRTDLQQAVAGTSIADVKIGSLGALGLPALPALPLPALPAQSVDISALTGPINGLLLPTTTGLLGGLLGPIFGSLPGNTVIPAGLKLPSKLDIDINPAIQALLKLPTADLLTVKAATTLAGASCTDGRAVTVGQHSLAGVSVLGNAIDVTTLGDQPILDTQSISLANLDPSLIQVPVLNILPTALVAPLKAVVVAALKALPPIPVPVDLLRVQVTPGSQAKTPTDLTENGPGIKISALGQPVVDLRLGQSKVGTTGVDCNPPAAPKPKPNAVAEPKQETAATSALACTTRRLVLTDVLAKGKRVKILGVADKRYVGRSVKIVFEADGKTAANAKVRSDGSFTTTAKLPSKRLRTSNKARYRAQVGQEKSRNLKLARRLFVDKVRSSNGRVRLVGHVSGPLGSPVQTITLTRRVSCKKSAVVKRFRPNAKGRFSVLVKAPAGTNAQVYRFSTKVRKTRSNKKLFPTFTLPTGVDLT